MDRQAKGIQMNGKVLIDTVDKMLDNGLTENEIIERINKMEQEWIDKKNAQTLPEGKV